MLTLKPVKGLLVRDPETRQPLKKTGEEKPRNIYWLRRLKEGSVGIVKTKKIKETE
ncbi:hypothetical protein VF_2640 [Aliivibrio fischeri ES114]|uniref:DUF2635 domain-containing protein n=1 Tax=Aliivibrio fischeri (strain ATCC 700601 / ES114) TaxID=312309 RepID=B1WN47_ALIF1|nr:DUF2635 domain-containing protein [Aliivibrio fischeri]ACB55679.1 hypothetical protein VF_2640 [Aliivibrio fischeri ES114]KLU79212.1 hypothetical protein AB192_06660 [Aliivibrio fischeri]